LGSYEAFLFAVVLAGVVQVILGAARMGFLASFIPSSVIKGLLAAVGVILILKQIPHLFGNDFDPEGDMGFFQFDQKNTLSELLNLFNDMHGGASLIGLVSLILLLVWDKLKLLKQSALPAPLVVVAVGVLLSQWLTWLGAPWAITSAHLVQVPTDAWWATHPFPAFAQWTNPKIYLAALTIAAVASLETLLSLEAVDQLDPQRRTSPPSRELLAQGVGNIASGLLGGLPVTSLVVRGSVNLNAGAQTKLAAILHGGLLLLSVLLLPMYLNLIPLSCLAAILFVTGLKLVSSKLLLEMWIQGRSQFIPFIITVLAIVFTDLLVGVLVGLGCAVGFILSSNMRRPLRQIIEKHVGGEVLRIELANQVSFLNRAVIARALDEVPTGGHILLDASNTDYIDPDVLDLIRTFQEDTGPARGVQVSLRGFRRRYQLDDRIQYVDYSTRELQAALTPEQVLQILKDGHERFRSGRRLTRDLGRQVFGTAEKQHPLAVVLSCIDSRTPAELIFDLGVGDIFSVRIAGNIVGQKILGSIEYAVAVAGAKLIVVIGHTRCGAVSAAVQFAGQSAVAATGCQHIDYVISDIQHSVDGTQLTNVTDADREAVVNAVARRNVQRSVEQLTQQSETLRKLVDAGQAVVVGAMYDVASGQIEFLGPMSTRTPALVV
jgi:carbonic anhydrase/SulP family sulfate permease